MFYREASPWDDARWPRSVPVAQRRGYDPALGRFAQADTIIPNSIQGLDRYAYVNNSPLNYVDPSGHRPAEDDEPNCKKTYCWDTEDIDRVSSLLGLSADEYIVWAYKNKDLNNVLINADAGDIVSFTHEDESGNTLYEDFMIVKYKDGYAFYDINAKVRVETGPGAADALAQNVSDAAVYDNQGDGSYRLDAHTQNFNTVRPMALPDGWDNPSDGGIIVPSTTPVNSAKFWTAVTCTLYCGGGLMTYIAGGGSAVWELLTTDTVPLYKDHPYGY